jgi:hypothetical protein
LSKPLVIRRAIAVPDESGKRIGFESGQRSLGERKVALWAICHVGAEAAAVKIFDGTEARDGDITAGVSMPNLLKTIDCPSASECK